MTAELGMQCQNKSEGEIMSEIIETFTASDGKTFTNKSDAENHNKFIKAQKAYNLAWTELKALDINSYKTADGFDFDDDASNWSKTAHYLIRGEFSLEPDIVEISLYPSNIRWISVSQTTIEICAMVYGYEGNEITFDLHNLYKKKENAEKRIVEILRKHIEQLEARISEIETKVR